MAENPRLPTAVEPLTLFEVPLTSRREDGVRGSKILGAVA